MAQRRGQASGLSTGTRRPPESARGTSATRLGPRLVVRRRLVRRPGEQLGQVPLHQGEHLRDGHVPAELLGQGGDAGVGDPAGHEPVVPGEVDVAVEREAVHGHAAADPDADGGDLAFRTRRPAWGAACSQTPLRPGTRAVVTPRSAQTAISASSSRRT